MDGQRRLIQQLHPTPREVPALRVSRSGFIQADIRHSRGNPSLYQRLSALHVEVLSRTCGIRGAKLRSTLR